MIVERSGSRRLSTWKLKVQIQNAKRLFTRVANIYLQNKRPWDCVSKSIFSFESSFLLALSLASGGDSGEDVLQVQVATFSTTYFWHVNGSNTKTPIQSSPPKSPNKSQWSAVTDDSPPLPPPLAPYQNSGPLAVFAVGVVGVVGMRKGGGGDA